MRAFQLFLLIVAALSHTAVARMYWGTTGRPRWGLTTKLGWGTTTKPHWGTTTKINPLYKKTAQDKAPPGGQDTAPKHGIVSRRLRLLLSYVSC